MDVTKVLTLISLFLLYVSYDAGNKPLQYDNKLNKLPCKYQLKTTVKDF